MSNKMLYIKTLKKMGAILTEDKKLMKFSKQLLIKDKNGIEYTVDYIENDNGNVYAYRHNPDGTEEDIFITPKDYNKYKRV